MIKYFLVACVAATALFRPAVADAQQPPAIIIEEDASLASGIIYQKWNVREITEVFEEKNFNGPMIAVLQPGDLVWGIKGDVHSSVVGKILVTRDHQARSGKWLLEGELIYPLYTVGNGVFKFWHQGDILIDSLLDIKGLLPRGETRAPIESKAWGVSIAELQRPGSEEWWVKVKLFDDKVGWVNRPYHFGNNGLLSHVGVTVVIDKRLVIFDSPPLLENGVIWVPAAKLAEHFGATSRWDEQRGMLTLSFEGKSVQLIKDSRAAIINGTVTTLDAAPRFVAGRFFVPLRPVVEALGRVIAWDGETRQARITERY